MDENNIGRVEEAQEPMPAHLKAVEVLARWPEDLTVADQTCVCEAVEPRQETNLRGHIQAVEIVLSAKSARRVSAPYQAPHLAIA